MMKAKRFAQSFLALVSCWAFSASARLDESEAQSQQRYGAPLPSKVDPLTYSPMIDGAICHTYKFQGWTIRAALINDKTVRINYSKILTKDVKPAIQDDELQAILAGETGGGQWQKAAAPGSTIQQIFLAGMALGKDFVNSNGNHAELDFCSFSLTLETPMAKAFIQARDAAKERQRKASVPKF